MSETASFHEVRFPVDVAFGSIGGPERVTEIVELASGVEKRNSRWADSRRRYDAGYGIRTLDDLYEVIAFFEQRRGRLHGFRFRDPLDWKSCKPSLDPSPLDQVIATGDGSTWDFQLTKAYGGGGSRYTRPITKPVAGTVVVAVAGNIREEGTDFTVDTATGIITFLAGSRPADGTTITAGYEFDVPVRFDIDRLQINLAAFQAGNLPAVPMVEVRL
ncbi:MAG: TIGR02217 family protein [Hyphomicrobiales bacterium]|nr:MAG: TIGR02217 family protein [Hyphomicrobiales bacterium]